MPSPPITRAITISPSTRKGVGICFGAADGRPLGAIEPPEWSNVW